MTSSRTEDFVRRLSDPDPAVAALVEDPDEITTRILRAALEQAELLGMRRSTMEDVAKRSGVGRATLYRRFPTKAALNDAIVLSEVRRFLEGSAQARAQGTTFEDRMVYDTVFTVTFIREHALLKKLLRTEPEAILPSLDRRRRSHHRLRHRLHGRAVSARVVRDEGHHRGTGTAPADGCRAADQAHPVVHRDPAHRDQTGVVGRHPGLRAPLPDADGHALELHDLPHRAAVGQGVHAGVDVVQRDGV